MWSASVWFGKALILVAACNTNIGPTTAHAFGYCFNLGAVLDAVVVKCYEVAYLWCALVP